MAKRKQVEPVVEDAPEVVEADVAPEGYIAKEDREWVQIDPVTRVRRGVDDPNAEREVE